MINSGMNVARMNFSHGAHADHEKVIGILRKIDGDLNSHTAILADLSGPKIRVGELAEPHVDLIEGAELRLTSETIIGTKERVSISYPGLEKDVNVGETILFDDGKLRVEVTGTDGIDVVTKVTQGGD